MWRHSTVLTAWLLMIDGGSSVVAQLQCVDLGFIGRAGFGFRTLAECNRTATQLGSIFAACPLVAPAPASGIRCAANSGSIVLTAVSMQCSTLATSLRGALRGNTGSTSTYNPFFTCVGNTVLADITMASCAANVPRIATLLGDFESAGLLADCAAMPTDTTSATSTVTSTVTTSATSSATTTVTSTVTTTLAELDAIFRVPLSLDSALAAELDVEVRRILGQVGLSSRIRRVEIYAYNSSGTAVVLKTTSPSDAELIRDLLQSSTGLLLTVRGSVLRPIFIDHLAVATTPFSGPFQIVFQLSVVGLNKTALAVSLQRYFRSLPSASPGSVTIDLTIDETALAARPNRTFVATLPLAAFAEIGAFVLGCTACPTFFVNGTFLQLCGHLVGEPVCGTPAPASTRAPTAAPTPLDPTLVSGTTHTPLRTPSSRLAIICGVLAACIIVGLLVWLAMLNAKLREANRMPVQSETQRQAQLVNPRFPSVFHSPASGVEEDIDGWSPHARPTTVAPNSRVPNLTDNGTSKARNYDAATYLDTAAERSTSTSYVDEMDEAASTLSQADHHFYPGTSTLPEIPMPPKSLQSDTKRKPTTAEEEANSFWVQ